MTLVRDNVTQADIEHLVNNLRERDRREIFALRWSDNPIEFIVEASRIIGPLWSAWLLDGKCIAVHGALPLRPGVVAAFAFGTPDWHHAARGIIKHVRHWLIPCLQAANYHRGEAFSLASNVDAHRFIEATGGEREAYLHQYGRDQEDFVLYRWKLNELFWWQGSTRGRLDDVLQKQ